MFAICLTLDAKSQTLYPCNLNNMNLDTIKKLRSDTGAGINNVKQALDEAQGDMAKAQEILRKKGLKIAAKKQVRETRQGIIDSYIHPPGRIAATVTLLCETDFVARNEEFKTLVHELAKQVAAMAPKYLSTEDVPKDEVNKEKEIYKEQLKSENKPDNVIENIVNGKLQKFYEQVCLLEQPWIVDDKKKIKDLITEATAKLGEKIEIREFTRTEL